MDARTLAGVALLLAAGGCSSFDPPKRPPQEVVVRVSSDPGRPLKGATILSNGQKLATTGDDGGAKLRLMGADGESFDVTVSCPEGFQSPTKSITVVLRRLADPSKVTEYDATCPPTSRTVVVAVRAENGPNLPVLYLGREVARTDLAGAAHVLLRVKPEEPFDLSLDTREKGSESLRPQNPSSSFRVKQQDEVFVFDAKFTVEKKNVVYTGPVHVGPQPVRRR